MTDDDLSVVVRRAQRGDTVAMSSLLARLTPLAARVCGPIADADGPDATQETLIAVFRNLRSLKDPSACQGWVRAIAVREAVRLAKRAARTVPVDPGERLDRIPSRRDIEQAADVSDVLARLSPEHRAVIVLRDVEGLDESEAAELLELPVGTVKSRLHRARDNFRKAWGV
ncbi:RNA polymerase sigma factor [Streptacidiphilus jiangxiensis]|uniref:RNA polymerase sigma factor n=1 Tax=Streptacidiphilus jiangxiensis TaxID=235985 RepID=UPI001F014D61|nr:sigma-70 family RNA polymerase sigma factor [Streptacidiphilus jiangxiensis]